MNGCRKEEIDISWASLVAQTAKNLSAMQEMQVLPLGQEDPLDTVHGVAKSQTQVSN